MKQALITTAAAAALAAGCGAGEPEAAFAERASQSGFQTATDAPVCRVADSGQPLPAEVRESSGLAQSRRDPSLFWTHNDAGHGPELFAVDASGGLVRQVRVTGAESADWEDIESGSCGAGDCLFVGDIGDNDAERERITVYRVAEPEGSAGETAPAEALHASFPGGPRDAESLFMLPTGDLFVVTKGRRGPIELFRFPAPQPPGATVTLERVRELFPEPENDDDRVTGATASPDGRWVGIRTYRTLYLYPAGALVGGGAAEPTRVDLAPLGQVQGESVVISADGSVWMTSESANDNEPPRWSRLQCTFPDA